MHLALRGRLTAVDRDPAVLALAQHNTAQNVATHRDESSAFQSSNWICDDVFNRPPAPGAWLNVDPDRRNELGRTTRVDRMSPTLDAIVPWMRGAMGGAIKLAPAAHVPELHRQGALSEWISHRGNCRQQVLWYGPREAAGAMRVTSIDAAGDVTTFEAESRSSCVRADRCDEYVFDLDPSLRASGLSGAYAQRFGLRCLGDPMGYFTATRDTTDGLARAFELRWQGPVDLRHIKRAVIELGVRVKGSENARHRLESRIDPTTARGKWGPTGCPVGQPLLTALDCDPGKAVRRMTLAVAVGSMRRAQPDGVHEHATCRSMAWSHSACETTTIEAGELSKRRTIEYR